MRNDNGVLIRRDGGGDDFALAHRCAQARFYYTDIDERVEMWCYDEDIAHVAVNGEDRHAFEYAIDGYDARIQCAVVAWFDRKRLRAKDCLVNQDALRTRHPFFSLCRDLGTCYPVTPRFFWICGSSSPWELVEWNVITGDRYPIRLLKSDKIDMIWKDVGLTKDHEVMKDYLRRKHR